VDLDATLVEELRRERRAHTILLYGSRARGDATAESDVDVAAFADVAETTRDARLWHGLYLDGFVYPTAALEEQDPDLLKLLGSRVLLDERGLAGPFLERLAALRRVGPPVLPESEQRMRRVWARKMLARIRRGDVEADYRRHWLLYQLLEDWFALRGEWYEGPKAALADLRSRDPDVFAAFERALRPGVAIDVIEGLVDVVAGPPNRLA